MCLKILFIANIRHIFSLKNTLKFQGRATSLKGGSPTREPMRDSLQLPNRRHLMKSCGQVSQNLSTLVNSMSSQSVCSSKDGWTKFGLHRLKLQSLKTNHKKTHISRTVSN